MSKIPLLENFVPLTSPDFLNKGVVINGVCYRLAGMSDLDRIVPVETDAWNGSESERKIAFDRDAIEDLIERFPGLQVIAEDSDGAVGWSCVGRIPEETDVINVPEFDDMFEVMQPGGELFEGIGNAVVQRMRYKGVGAHLIIAGQAAVAHKILQEAQGQLGGGLSVELDAIFEKTDSTASVRVPGYGRWLADREEDPSDENLTEYVVQVALGLWQDSVLGANLSVMKQTGGLTGIIGIKGGCKTDADSGGRGLRTRRIKLVRAFAEGILERRQS